MSSRSLKWWLRQMRRHVVANAAAMRVGLMPVRPAEESHGLPGRLIVSLTSYPPRFPTLVLTLKCLLGQSMRADTTVLWVARADIDGLPAEVRRLESHGLTIRVCDDMGPYKKIVPAIEAHPDAYIVTADDDREYPRKWLASLVRAQVRRPGCIVCHSARVIGVDGEGRLTPYKGWREARSSGDGQLLPTGYGGVLYPPGSLHERVTNRTEFMELSPRADDLWLKWMSAEVGTPVELVPCDGPSAYEWPGSQRSSLLSENVHQGGNDKQLGSLSTRFGTTRLLGSA